MGWISCDSPGLLLVSAGGWGLAELVVDIMLQAMVGGKGLQRLVRSRPGASFGRGREPLALFPDAAERPTNRSGHDHHGQLLPAALKHDVETLIRCLQVEENQQVIRYYPYRDQKVVGAAALVHRMPVLSGITDRRVPEHLQVQDLMNCGGAWNSSLVYSGST
jgi:hypothetical protein